MEVNNLKDFITNFNVPVADVAKNALDKPSKEIGEGVGNLLWLVFSPIHLARSRLDPFIRDYKIDIENEVSKIPSDKLVEPPLNVVGPAIEASKYYIEHEGVRSMFAKLVAASMDANRQPLVHPSFVEVIKQLSPFDAKLFKLLLDNASWPVAEIRAYTEGVDGGRTIHDNFFPFPDLTIDNLTTYESAIQNLLRLSLIDIDYSYSYQDVDRYALLEKHQLFLALTEYALQQKHDRSLNLRHGTWSVTQFGDFFQRCCV